MNFAHAVLVQRAIRLALSTKRTCDLKVANDNTEEAPAKAPARFRRNGGRARNRTQTIVRIS